MLRPTLLVFVAQGCPACEKAKPEVDRFKTRNPLQMTLVLDADGPFAAHFGLVPIRATPFYVLKLGAKGLTHDSFMRAEQIERWVKVGLAALEEEP